ncbi:MAG: hypothetical protein ABF335_02810 [Alphaproteobacteria bacterium]
MIFQDFEITRITLLPLADELAHSVADLLSEGPFNLNLPLILVHDLAMTLTIDLLEASEVSSPKFHGLSDEIEAVITDCETRSAAANRMLYIAQIATVALTIAKQEQN